MATEWSNKKAITFLEILQTEPCLWDPKHKGYKNRGTQNDAWRRIIEKIPFQTTIEEIKKKKESLMGYYRIHLNKIKKTLKSGAGKDDVYTTNWFAFETMDNFLRRVYDRSRTLKTEANDDNEAQEGNYFNQNSSHLSTETEEATENILEGNGTRPTENRSQNYGRKRLRQMDEAFKMKEKKDDECEIFGRLIAIKLKQISNPNTRDTLMNDIQNLVFRACLDDRLEQESAVPQSSTS
ncbi:uncharacterized protein LOC124640356 [Helicoverpa zea]|uniref:uncharacterized protein LOC124640356 n=1 Tax=Helicoverpa zea TaxID=7113 RepID=UPI001F574B23|nr:uncharacterized protein LOC124640356 [Helicoverpa zea]